MTTQTEVTKSIHVVQPISHKKTSILPVVLAALVILSVISAAVLIIPSTGGEHLANRPALEAMSARSIN